MNAATIRVVTKNGSDGTATTIEINGNTITAAGGQGALGDAAGVAGAGTTPGGIASVDPEAGDIVVAWNGDRGIVISGVDGVVVPGDPNLVVLDIGDSAAYLESLEKAGWLTMSVLPAEQPDPIFRGINPS